LVTGAVAPQYQVRPVLANAAAPTVEERTRIAAWDSANERSIGFLSGAMEKAIARQVQDAAETAAGAGNQVTAQHWWDQASALYNIQPLPQSIRSLCRFGNGGCPQTSHLKGSLITS